MLIEHETLKKELKNQTFRKLLKEKLGTECYSCGSTENIEYHHIVPIALGGTNRITNIVPLCFKCHKLAHDGRNIIEYNKKTGNVGGRTRKVPDNFSDILKDYVTCKINKKECAELLGVSERSVQAVSPWMKEFLESEGITEYRNKLLIIQKNGNIENNRKEHKPIGYCIFKDGHKEEYYAS